MNIGNLLLLFFLIKIYTECDVNVNDKSLIEGFKTNASDASAWRIDAIPHRVSIFCYLHRITWSHHTNT